MIDDGIVAGLILYAVMILLPLFSLELSKNIPTVLTYWFLIAIHQAVAFTNAYFFTTFGADGDPADFHRIGAELAQVREWSFAIGSGFYAQTLGLVYGTFGTSPLLGQQLSILAFALSCLVLLKILSLLKLSSYGVFILLCFGALPTMVLMGPLTFREPFQILFFVFSVYSGLKFHIVRKKRFIVGLVVSALTMGLFHNGLMLYAMFLIFLVLAWRMRGRTRLGMISKHRLLAWMLLPLVIVGIWAIINLAPHIVGMEVLSSLGAGRGMEYITLYREQRVEARATYGVILDTSSWGSLMLTSLPVFFYYLLAPFPWQVGNLLDIYAFMESLWRMVLIYFAIRQWRSVHGPLKSLYGLMLMLYFSMAFLWALGTNNYGTAIRHHMVHYWIIVVLGLPPLVDYFKNVMNHISNHRNREWVN